MDDQPVITRYAVPPGDPAAARRVYALAEQLRVTLEAGWYGGHEVTAEEAVVTVYTDDPETLFAEIEEKLRAVPLRPARVWLPTRTVDL